MCSTNINVTVTEVVLTPITCADLVNEILKYLIYQKSQIPYPYNWLQTVVNRKKESPNDEVTKTTLITKHHYRVIVTAFETLKEIMQNIRYEFENPANIVLEISILFGPTPYTTKEVFTVKVPRLVLGHNEVTHSNLMNKNRHKVLRKIFFRDDWLNVMEYSIPSTNMYVMLKKQSNPSDGNETNFFLPIKEYSLPNKVRNVIINLHYGFNDVHSCCKRPSVFDDSTQGQLSSEKTLLNTSEDESGKNKIEEGHWYQARLLFKGYKDCFVNNISVSELF